MRGVGTIAVIAIILISAAACGTDTSDLEQRIAALETQAELGDEIAALETQAELGDEIVVGVKAEATTPQTCIRYRAFGSVEETCVFRVETSTRTEAHRACITEVRVGEPLPDSCR